MAYQNIYDLGDVDLYVEFLDSGTLVPAAEADLGGGTVQAVGGVIQCRDMPSTISNQAIRIVAVPLFSRGSPLPARVTLSQVDLPQDDPFSDFEANVGVNPPGATTSLTPVFVDDVCTSFEETMPLVLPAELDATPDSGDNAAGLAFRFVEVVA